MYDPSELPQSSVEDLARAVTEELIKIAEVISVGQFAAFNLIEQNASLAKPRDGDIVNADGTNFNPGTGKGIYYYNGSTYVKLG